MTKKKTHSERRGSEDDDDDPQCGGYRQRTFTASVSRYACLTSSFYVFHYLEHGVLQRRLATSISGLVPKLLDLT